MDITFSCPDCSQNIVIDEAGAGMEIQCPSCQRTLVVPSPQPAAVVSVESTTTESQPAVSEREPPQVAEELLLLTQLCPKCERAWPENIRVCEHCGTILAEPAPTAPDGLRVPSVPRISSGLRINKPVASPVAPPQTAAAPPTPPVEAPATAVAPAQPVGVAEYQCINPHCGCFWAESQLRKQLIGRKTILVCPKCGLAATKLKKPVNFWMGFLLAFIWPFKGAGGWILGTGTVLLTFLDLGSKFGFGLGWLIAVVFKIGFFGMLLIHVIRTSCDNEEDHLDWPDLSGFGEILVVFFQLLVSTLLVFSPAILCLIQSGTSFFDVLRGGGDEGIMSGGLWLLLCATFFFLGAVYYPMALLSVAMFDSIKGVNPMIVLPSIFKVPLQYLVILVVLVFLLVIRFLLGIFAMLFPFPYFLIVLLPVECFALYTLIVSARLLGIMYKANHEKIGWFN